MGTFSSSTEDRRDLKVGTTSMRQGRNDIGGCASGDRIISGVDMGDGGLTRAQAVALECIG